MTTISPADLARSLTSSPPELVVLDVRLADDHARIRIPASIHQCVFETVFLDQVGTRLADPAQAVVVVGSSDASCEATMAAEKLERAGHRDIRVLEGGLAGWQEQGHPTDGDGSPPPTDPALDGSRAIDLEASTVTWTGRNLLNHHTGTVGLKSGQLEFGDNRLTGGRVDFDLHELHCHDLAGSELHDVLIRHLHDHDFLDLERFPEASLEITAAEPVPPACPGSPNLRVTGRLELRGQVHEIRFDAAAGRTPDGKAAAQAAFTIDRTRWGILYGSGRFFDRLAGHLVNDLIEFQVKIVTT